ncbi:MAG: DUF5655 domain-containing protein [Acidobacteriota bacterium]
MSPAAKKPPADLAAHFAGRDPAMLELYRELLALVARSGPFTVVPDKSRIVFRARAPFMAIAPRQMHLIGHFVFPRRVANPRFQRIDTISPGRLAHHFCLERSDELDPEFAGWIRDAYAVGAAEPLAELAPPATLR